MFHTRLPYRKVTSNYRATKWTCLRRIPKTGLGHPEALRGGGDITWSRHITAHDRIIYDIYEGVVEVYILEVEGHYNDK